MNVSSLTAPLTSYPLQNMHNRLARITQEHLPLPVFEIINSHPITHLALIIIIAIGYIYLQVVTTATCGQVLIVETIVSGVLTFLQGLSSSDANYMISSGINPIHYTKTIARTENLLTLFNTCNGSNIDLDELIPLFDTINFHNPELPDYIDPKRIENDSGRMCNVRAKDCLKTLVANIKDKSFILGAPNDESERIAYYDYLEKLLKVIIYKIKQGHLLINVQNNILIRIATAGDHCAARYTGEILESYCRATETEVSTSNIENDILKKLQTMRHGLIHEILTESHSWLPAPLHVHMLNQYRTHLGPMRGLQEAPINSNNDLTFYLLSFATAKHRFDSKYTKSYILERVSWWINGQPSDEDPSIRMEKEIEDTSVLVDWFKDHIPNDWQPTSSITEEEILQQMDILKKDRIREVRNESENRYMEIQNTVTAEMARESCIAQAFLEEFVYHEDMTIINTEAIEYMLKSMQILI